jgi:hypothetical protein
MVKEVGAHFVLGANSFFVMQMNTGAGTIEMTLTIMTMMTTEIEMIETTASRTSETTVEMQLMMMT